MGGSSERQKEIRRRRIRKERVTKFKARSVKAGAEEKAVIANKLRKLTPGAQEIIENLGLEN